MKYLTAVNRLEPFETAVRKYKIQSVEKNQNFQTTKKLKELEFFQIFVFSKNRIYETIIIRLISMLHALHSTMRRVHQLNVRKKILEWPKNVRIKTIKKALKAIKFPWLQFAKDQKMNKSKWKMSENEPTRVQKCHTISELF